MSFLSKIQAVHDGIRSGINGAVLGASMSLSIGGPYSEATGWSSDRSNIMYMAPADSRQTLPRWTRLQIYGKVQWLFENFGVVKEGVRGIARHTVGRGRSLQLNSDDEEWNELGELDWETYAQSKSRCDLAGRRTFYEYQTLAVEQRMKAGEFLAAFCQNPRWKATRADGSLLLDEEGEEVGDPCLVAFGTSEVQTPPDKSVADRVFDGVQLDENSAPVGYHVQRAGGQWQIIPDTEMIHWYKADEINQTRGVSEFAQAVARLVDIHDLIKVTTKSGKTHGAMALLVKKAAKLGGPGSFSNIRKGGKAPTPAPPPVEGQPQGGATQVAGQPLEQVFGGGAIMYVTEDGDVKLVNSTQPSPLVEPFITDLLMRDVCAGWGVPAEFFWAIAKLSGANTRAILSKADLLFVVLGDGVDTEIGIPWATRYLLHRMATGKLRQCKDPNWMLKMAFQGPPKLSVDEGRTGALEVVQLANGVETMQSIQDKRGRGWRAIVQQWFREWAFAARCAKKEGVPQALKLWRPAPPGTTGSTPDEKEEESAQDDAANDGDEKSSGKKDDE